MHQDGEGTITMIFSRADSSRGVRKWCSKIIDESSVRTLRNLKAFFLCIFGGGAQQKVRELFILFTKN